MTIDLTNPILIEMRKLHQTITINEERIPFYPLSSQFHLIMTEATTEEWYVWGPQSKRIFKQDSRSIPEQNKKDMVDIINEWNCIQVPTHAKPGPVAKADKPITQAPKTKKPKHGANKRNEDNLDRFGMELIISYPPEMKGKLMKFNQWLKENKVLPNGGEVLILDEDEYNYTVQIPQAKIGFVIGRGKVEIVDNEVNVIQ